MTSTRSSAPEDIDLSHLNFPTRETVSPSSTMSVDTNELLRSEDALFAKEAMMSPQVEEKTKLLQAPEATEDDANSVTNISFCSHPLAVKIILINELCERFSYYGYRAILSLYLQSEGFGDDATVAIFSYFSALAYVMPLLGGHISDGYWGRYRTIIIFSLIYLVGSVTLALGAWETTNPSHAHWFVFLALSLTSLGTGGIKPCVSTFGADQLRFDDAHTHTQGNDEAAPLNPRTPASSEASAARQNVATQSFFYLFYFTMNIGSTLATIFIPIVRTHVSYAAAFALPALLLAISVVILLVGQGLRSFTHVPPNPNGSALSRVLRIVALAWRRRGVLSATYMAQDGRAVDAHAYLQEYYARELDALQLHHTCRCDDGLGACGRRPRSAGAAADSSVADAHEALSLPSLKCLGCSGRRLTTSLAPLTSRATPFSAALHSQAQAVHTFTPAVARVAPSARVGQCCASGCDGSCDCGCACGSESSAARALRSMPGITVVNDSICGNDAAAPAVSDRLAAFLPWLDAAMAYYAPLDTAPLSTTATARSASSSSSSFSLAVPAQPVPLATLLAHAEAVRSSSASDAYKYGFSCSDIADARRLFALLPVFAVFPVFWCLMNQQGSTWMLQAQDMQLSIGGYAVEPEQLSVLNPIFLFALLPLFEWVFRRFFGSTDAAAQPLPAAAAGAGEAATEGAHTNASTQPLPPAPATIVSDATTEAAAERTGGYGCLRSPLGKMFLGMLCAALAYVCAALVDLRILASEPHTVSIGWQIPQYFLVTVAEVLVSVTGLHMAFEHAPQDMKSLVTALLMLSSAIGDIITSAFYSTFSSMGMTRWMMFVAFAVCVVLNGGALLFVRKRFGKLLGQ